MSIQKHRLNIELSKELFEDCVECFALKECFNNVYEATYIYEDQFAAGDWKVAYGYYPFHGDNYKNMYAKHCFIINQKNEVIDPTIILHYWRDFSEDIIYISHTIFEYDDYINALEEEGGREYFQPALYNYLRKTEQYEMLPWANENGIILMG